MARQHGITSSTPKRLLLDAGAAWVNYGEANARRLGATRGGSSFNLEEERREIAADGALGPIAEMRRVTRSVPRLNTTLIEFSLANWRLAIPGTFSVTNADWEVIKRTGAQITPDFFVSNMALLAEVAQTNIPAIIKVLNALIEGNLTLATAPADEGSLPIQATGHVSLGDLETQPWEIWWPTSAV